ncbi:quinolinate synthase NadA [Desulfurobacterium atlanticum]|uniref:Quinolinate synthase n=1 Tax=Desulfurobacterium atlanticum TaxID=240169 RepID=A0A238YNJ3_9BACT|nr:quinolinate synthase NadA [Desulfurobacterium atlanticum]SNR72153.1 quinolinate synthetase [Desulfurobacterium atlanticum]
MRKDVIEKILTLKNEKNAVILAHFYQEAEIQEAADFVGDSLELARKATEIEADIIVMCGVYFMAETVKILNPDKKVLIPYPKAGCLMADMVLEDELKKFKEENPDYAVVTYVNSTAEVKALSDICCTSANAVKVVNSLDTDKILFTPDRNLGEFIAEQVEGKEIKLWQGYCPVHEKVPVESVRLLKKMHPEAAVLVHPECKKEIRELADFVGSTSKIINFVKETKKEEFIIGTEMGIIHQLKKAKPEGKFYPAYQQFICDQMKMITAERLINCLEEEKYEVDVDREIAEKAKIAIDKMLSIK